MTQILSSRQTRRRGIVFAILIAITLLLMAFSANPYIQEAQRAFSFALRPFQGALADVADNVSGVVSAITEIDSLRIDNASLRNENERLDERECAAPGARRGRTTSWRRRSSSRVASTMRRWRPASSGAIRSTRARW